MSKTWLTPSSLLLSAVLATGCGNGGDSGGGPNRKTIDSLAGSTLRVTVAHTPDQATINVLLAFREVGMKLGTGCPVVVASATVNGAQIAQTDTGGPSGCDPPNCGSQGTCLGSSWDGAFPTGFPPSSDGMLTIQLTDEGAPAMMVSGLDMWADASLSAISIPATPDGQPQATLTLAPRPPYSQIGVDATTVDIPFVRLTFNTNAGQALVMLAATGEPNSFQVSFPSATALPRPVTGELVPELLFGTASFAPPTPVCSGVSECLTFATATLPPLPVSLP